jgi:hypothetical protein
MAEGSSGDTILDSQRAQIISSEDGARTVWETGDGGRLLPW